MLRNVTNHNKYVTKYNFYCRTTTKLNVIAFTIQLFQQERFINNGLILALVILLAVTILTLVLVQFKFVNLLALLVIISCTASLGILIYWYKQGTDTNLTK